MLASVVLLACLVAGIAAMGILFVLFGPVPVNRRVTIVARIVPMPTAVGPVAMPGMPVFDPAQAQFAARPAIDQSRAEFAPAIPPPPPAAVEPPRRAKRPPAPIAQVQLRRPRTTPAPLVHTRSARGTEPRPRHIAFDVEHTAADVPLFEVDDPTFLEDDIQ